MLLNNGIELTGHFETVARKAREFGAYRVSIQSYYTFCNFNNVSDATMFNTWCNDYKLETMGINLERPYIVAEVAVHHPG